MHLNENNIECLSFNGHITPSRREGRFDVYQSCKIGVIVSTDIGSRGLDTIRTGHVLNYDFPRFLADYVHRCGRTGRVGSKIDGRVTNFVSWASEVALVQEIEVKHLI